MVGRTGVPDKYRQNPPNRHADTALDGVVSEIGRCDW